MSYTATTNGFVPAPFGNTTYTLTIQETKNWDAENSHDSNLTFAEMKTLIKGICEDIEGMESPPDTMPTEIQNLSTVLRGKKNGVLFLDKGIHQADELHYTISCVAAAKIGSFHVYVKQGTTVAKHTKPAKFNTFTKALGLVGKSAEVKLFKYVNSGITYQEHPQSPALLWPALFIKENLYPTRKRGNSFCAGNVQVVTSRGPSIEENQALAKQMANAKK
jgi:hypothetical protein